MIEEKRDGPLENRCEFVMLEASRAMSLKNVVKGSLLVSNSIMEIFHI